MKKVLGAIAVIYVVLAVAIAGVQLTTGTGCDPIVGTVPKVEADYPRGLLGAMMWPVSFYEQVWRDDVPLREYLSLSPTVCV